MLLLPLAEDGCGKEIEVFVVEEEEEEAAEVVEPEAGDARGEILFAPPSRGDAAAGTLSAFTS